MKRWEVVGSERIKGGGRKPLDPELFGKMTIWYEDMKKKGIKPNTLEISKKAIEISCIEDFKGSKGWVSKFLDYMKRNSSKIEEETKRRYESEKFQPINSESSDMTNSNESMEEESSRNDFQINPMDISRDIRVKIECQSKIS